MDHILRSTLGARLILLGGVAAATIACGTRVPETPSSRPNLLLITIDTTRADHCSAFGYEKDTTPRLESFAAEATLFRQAYSHTATTAPTHATLFTSLYPLAHHVTKNGVVLGDDHATLAEILAGRDYRTAGIVSSYVMERRFGLGQGFAEYQDRFVPEESTRQRERWAGHQVAEGEFDRRADHTTDRAIRFLEEAGERPFFLFVHYFDPHAPYTPPEPFASRFAAGDEASRVERAIGRYDGEIAFTDEQIGRLLDALARRGLERDTLVVIVADHGEGLMTHGHMKHGVHIYEEAVRVPLLVRWPGRVPAGRVVDAVVALVDLGPTLLELLGAPVEGQPFQGRSLAAAFRGEEPFDSRREIFLQRRHYDGGIYNGTYAEGEKFGVRAGSWKYIVGEEEETRELFDLSEDPGEARNLHDDFPEVAARLAARLEEWRRRHARAGEAPPPIPDEEAERLEALGYVQ
jgi:arylsulfatase A-like enzyme